MKSPMMDADSSAIGRLMDRFLGRGEDLNHKHDKLVAEIWNRRNDSRSATYEALYEAVWPENRESDDDLGKTKNFNTNVSRARTELAKFCREDFHARFLPFSLSIDVEDSVYQIAPVKRPKPLASPAELLWESCLTNDKAPLIISTEPLVFADEEDRCFFRFLEINAAPQDKRRVAAEINAYLRKVKAQDRALEKVLRRLFKRLRPCYHYQPSGEVLAALNLETWFQKRLPPARAGGPAALRLLSRQVDFDRFHAKNAIILGNLRTNTFVRDHQEKHRPPIQITPADIRIDGDPPFVDDQRTACAVVTRVSRTPTDRERTIVAANNGRALHAAVEALLNDDTVLALFAELHAPSGFSLPPNFQVLYQVNLDEHNVQGNNCTIVRALPFEPARDVDPPKRRARTA
jgi:hypothetical protein